MYHPSPASTAKAAAPAASPSGDIGSNPPEGFRAAGGGAAAAGLATVVVSPEVIVNGVSTSVELRNVRPGVTGALS